MLNLPWLSQSLIALFFFSIMSFLIVILSKRGYPVSFILFSLSIVLVIFTFIQWFNVEKYKPRLNLEVIFIIIVIGILSSIANLALFQAAKNAPNSGLALAIGSSYAGLTALYSFFILKDRLNFTQIIGLITIIVAIFLINLGSSKAH